MSAGRFGGSCCATAGGQSYDQRSSEAALSDGGAHYRVYGKRRSAGSLRTGRRRWRKSTTRGSTAGAVLSTTVGSAATVPAGTASRCEATARVRIHVEHLSQPVLTQRRRHEKIIFSDYGGRNLGGLWHGRGNPGQCVGESQYPARRGCV